MDVSTVSLKGSIGINLIQEEAARKVATGTTRKRRPNKSRSRKSHDDFLSILTSMWQMNLYLLDLAGNSFQGSSLCRISNVLLLIGHHVKRPGENSKNTNMSTKQNFTS